MFTSSMPGTEFIPMPGYARSSESAGEPHTDMDGAREARTAEHPELCLADKGPNKRAFYAGALY